MLARERWSANRLIRRFRISTRQSTWRTKYDDCTLYVVSSAVLLTLSSLQTPIGKVDEVLGPINQVYFTVKPQEGIVASSFKAGDKFYIGGDKLLPIEKYDSGILRALNLCDVSNS